MIKKAFAFLLVSIVLLTGCGNTHYVITTGFDKNELMRINGESTYLSEMMLYLTTIQNQYEAVYTDKLWDESRGENTLETEVKEMVLAKLAQIKVMNLMAAGYNLTFTDEELAKINKISDDFYNSLNDTEIELIGVTKDDIVMAYKEYAMADKVYEFVIRDVNPEISDDEARTITVQVIGLKMFNLDAKGNHKPYSERAKSETYETAKLILELLESNEDSFESLQAKYSDIEDTSYTFGRNEMDLRIEEAAFSLGKDEVSEVVECDDMLYILKCISDFDIAKTQLNKVTILGNRKSAVFNETYEAYLSTITKILNENLYNKIEMIHDENVTTHTFFDADL